MRALPFIAGGLFFATLAALSSRRKRVTAKGYKTTAAAHLRAQALAAEAFEDVVHVPATLNELRMLLAVALHETTFGAGWRGDGAGSNNMGSIHATSGYSGKTFGGIDSAPTATGGTTYYPQAFRAYDTPLEGWQDLVRVLYLQAPATRTAAASGDPKAMADAMFRAGYYQGQGATRAERIGSYEQALVNALWEVDHFWQKGS